MVPWCVFSYFETLAQEQSLQAIQEILDTYEVSWVAPRGVLGLKKRSTKISTVWENDWKSFLMVIANIYSHILSWFFFQHKIETYDHMYIYIHIFVAGKQGWRPLLLLKVYGICFWILLGMKVMQISELELKTCWVLDYFLSFIHILVIHLNKKIMRSQHLIKQIVLLI